MTDCAGNVSNWYEYLPFGEMLMEQSSNSYDNPYKYNGKELDVATGLYYYGARYYDPRTSLFQSVDPLVALTLESYTYALNNPVMYHDPTGLFTEDKGTSGPGDKVHEIEEVILTAKRRVGSWWSRNISQPTNNFFNSVGKWWNKPVDASSAQAAEDLAHSSMPGNFTIEDTNGGVVMSVAVAFGSAMQEANGFRYPRYTPKNSAKINNRHYLNSTSIAGGKTRAGTFAPKEILDLDISTYNGGDFTNANNGNGDVSINGRIYGVKNEGKTLFPRSGGSHHFKDLSQAQIKAIQLLKTVPSNKVEQAIKGAGISTQDFKFAKDFIEKH